MPHSPDYTAQSSLYSVFTRDILRGFVLYPSSPLPSRMFINLLWTSRFSFFTQKALIVFFCVYIIRNSTCMLSWRYWERCRALFAHGSIDVGYPAGRESIVEGGWHRAISMVLGGVFLVHCCNKVLPLGGSCVLRWMGELGWWRFYPFLVGLRYRSCVDPDILSRMTCFLFSFCFSVLIKWFDLLHPDEQPFIFVPCACCGCFLLLCQKKAYYLFSTPVVDGVFTSSSFSDIEFDRWIAHPLSGKLIPSQPASGRGYAFSLFFFCFLRKQEQPIKHSFVQLRRIHEGPFHAGEQDII